MATAQHVSISHGLHRLSRAHGASVKENVAAVALAKKADTKRAKTTTWCASNALPDCTGHPPVARRLRCNFISLQFWVENLWKSRRKPAPVCFVINLVPTSIRSCGLHFNVLFRSRDECCRSYSWWQPGVWGKCWDWKGERTLMRFILPCSVYLGRLVVEKFF